MQEAGVMPGRAGAAVIRLSRKRCRKLEQIVRAATSPQRLVLRAGIGLAAAGGASNAAIAADLGCSVATARTWRGRLARRGGPGPFAQPPRGRPGTHGPPPRPAAAGPRTPPPA